MELTDEQKAQAARIEAIIVQKDETGEYVYTKDEVRDFIVAAIFELNLPLDARLEKVLLNFCEQFEIPEETTEEELIEYMRRYFKERPLNPALLKEFEEFGRGELLTREEGYKDASAQVNSLRAAGNTGGPSAPRAEPAKRKDVKPKRGISK